LIDLLLLATWIWHATVVLSPERSQATRPGSSMTAAYAASESIGWDPTPYSHPNARFALMLTGTLPAGVISSSIRPEAGWQTRHRLWDPVWLLVHEAVAIPLWFLVGTWLDAGRANLGRLMGIYLMGRVALAALTITLPGDQKWWALQFLFWVGLGGYGALQAMHWLRRSSSRSLA
jgi:hypothetical protein